MGTSVRNYRAGDVRGKDAKLFDIFNELEAELNEGASHSNAASEAICAMFEYTRNDMPREFGMETDGEYFKTTVNSYLSLMQFGNLPPAREVRNFLASWINSRSEFTQALDRR
jgi:hypothetical protein